MARTYRIGEVARETGVTAEALRYYEQQGLLPKAGRTGAGARLFAEDVLRRVRFIKQAQSAGLTLRDVQVLVGSAGSRTAGTRTACQRIRSVLAVRIEEIDNRLVELQTFRRTLSTHLDACDRALADPDDCKCPTIEAIADGTESGK